MLGLGGDAENIPTRPVEVDSKIELRSSREDLIILTIYNLVLIRTTYNGN